MTLASLTDRDLLLNLWLTVLVLAEASKIDVATCEQTLLRDGQNPQLDAPAATLADLLHETETRLGLSGGLGGFKQGRAN